MRILLVMLFSLVLAACGQDYEEVHGIKLGASIKEVDGLNKYEKDTLCELTTYYLEPYKDMEWVFLVVMDGVVHSVSVGVNKDDYEAYIAEVNSKYGEPSRVEVADGEFSLEYRPEGVVDVVSIGSTNHIAQYLTKKLADNYIEMTIDCI